MSVNEHFDTVSLTSLGPGPKKGYIIGHYVSNVVGLTKLVSVIFKMYFLLE